MKQNKYDDPYFFAKYSEMPRSMGGLEVAGEWPAFRALLPDLQEKRVLDFGCGFGWHCRYARQQGAASVVGVDISVKMLARAREIGADPKIEYRLAAIEDIEFEANEFDIVISSLVFHYVEHFDLACQKVYRCLVPGGAFVLSMEHPIFTSRAAQDWCRGPDHERLHWPVDNYHEEGARHTQWLADGVIKYHRTIASTIKTLIDSGFALSGISEPGPSPEMIRLNPDWADEVRRPMFLLLAAIRL